MNPLCPKCKSRQREWRNDRKKYRPTCKLCRVPTSNIEKQLRQNGIKNPQARQGFENCAALGLRKEFCGQCRYVAEHPCQLDVDHIDGDIYNDDPSNLQILCANCHRLKTFTSRDGTKRNLVLSQSESNNFVN